MRHEVAVGSRTIPFELVRRNRGKNMTIRVELSGTVRVSIPRWVSIKETYQYVRQQGRWIFQQQKRQAEKAISGDLRSTSERHYIIHRPAARRLVKARVAYWADQYGVSYGKLTVRRMKSRWGSCSSEGNMSFNYKLLFLPEQLQEYVVVHEVCHLLQMNHSPAFWALVGESIPNYRRLKRELAALA